MTPMSSPKRFIFAARDTLLVIVSLSVFSPVRAQIVPDHYIAVLNDNFNIPNPPALSRALAAAHGVRLGAVYQHALKGFSFAGPAAAAQALAQNPLVAFVEPDLEVHADLHENNFQTLPTGVDRVDADLNSTADIDGMDNRVDVDIAILDTGIDLDHLDLNVFFNKRFSKGGGGNQQSAETAAVGGDDDNGHGTHVAGSAAALDNGIGVVGVSPGARLWALKVLDRNGSGSFSDVIAAIDFVTLNAAEIEVVNMSLGGTGKLDALRIAIQKSVDAGVVYVVSAGNDSRDVYGLDGVFDTGDEIIPAAYPEVAAISAMGDTDGQAGGLGPNTSRGTADDTFADFTNFSNAVVEGNPVNSPGAAIDLAGPGVDITSTWKDGLYATISGTSMSSPHVAGAAALLAATGRAFDAAGVAAIRQALIDAAQDQSAWSSSTNDPDGNHEGLVNVASGTPNDPPVANDRPVVSITSPADESVFPSGATIPFPFAGTASDTEDGDLTASLAWTSDIKGPIGTGGSFSTTLSDGTHTITASVIDSGGKSGSASITITVGTPPAEPTVSVSSIDYTTEGGKNGDKHLNMTVKLTDDLDNPVSGASVSIRLDNTTTDQSWSGAATTGGGGTVTFTLKNAPSGCYTTTVTDVTAAGLTWDGLTPAKEFCK